ncbi:AraC family transcriptional regulator [Nocardia seriolae]|uniref:AraC family transcriptional regulator n=1 Tax=Nocardia seriolae TaxID=37332 RepID=A0A0B8NFD6_9NOCA|nr:AraC family transcriptional regulator [Nocardia seriolae]MTJ64097.1 helix-turn-helix domain-containing protein [Nocardia seriolae]MTJ73650.1 helix-turn-helix domain-containing protein [Nocardia seriolae]MTJ88124.1 helix-turn-helix domain-containing protein [Nocardia seriolae]MTK32113.1 helix-turn-helix domain-containing protein [Nocardia seriolae]MTK41983.1 helix-turn-helix domain-containing protein [Nocardia seriolae]
METDVLSDAVAALTTAPALSVHTRAREPWGLRFGGRQGFGFHVIVRGECALVRAGTLPIPLHAGDVVLMPSGAAHALANPHDARAVDLALNHRIDRVAVGGAGAETIVVSGAYRIERGVRHPLLADLPEVVHLRGGGRQRLAAAVELLGAEIEAREPGGDAVVTALVDALLIYLLRAWHEDNATGWTAAMTDPAIGHTLRGIHAHPAEPWTVDRLAGETGLARATFIRRFTRLVGEPPITYLTRWRMITAARMLRRDRAPLATVARRVGYTSEFAFAKAFKREYGLSPGAYRRTTGSAG